MSRHRTRWLRDVASVSSVLAVAAGPVAAHGGAAESTEPSLLASIPSWVGAAVGLALVALGVVVVGRALGGRANRAVGGVAAVFLAGSLLVVVVGVTGIGGPGGPASETPLWMSDTGRETGGNHHAAAISEGRVYAPVSGPGTPEGCELVALHGADGGVVWRAPVETNCTIHAVADPAVADTDGDGEDEVLVATTEEDLRVYSQRGELLRSSPLSAYGYTRPAVGEFDDGSTMTVVVDVRGTVVAVDAAGAETWSYALDDYVWARPVVDDVDGDGATEVLVAQRDGTVSLLGGTSEPTVEWSTTVGDSPDSSWLTVGDADADPALELFVAGFDGTVYAIDGASGDVEWTWQGDSRAAVGGFGDGDGDGVAEVYVADSSGRVRALDAESGRVEWTTRVTDGSVQMMPPPALGDTDGDGSADLVAPAHDGRVAKLDPTDGHVVAQYIRESDARGQSRIFSRATLGDVDGDGDDDAVVIYADGTVVALDF